MGVAMFFAAPWFVRLFSSDPNVIAIGVLQFRTETLFYCLLAFSHSVAGVCRGAGKAVVPMLVMLCVWCVFRIAYITVIMHYIHEIQYLFWAYPITWGISSVIFCIYLCRSDWLHGLDKMES